MAAHYFLDKQPPEIQKRAKEGTLDGPYFVGQGLTTRCGSDAYGHYIDHISPDCKSIGIIDSDSSFASSWTEGSMTSTLPKDAFELKPENLIWLRFYGGKWYYAGWSKAENKVVRRRGSKVFPNWNGAYDYRDPSL